MRDLSASLIETQQSACQKPFVRVRLTGSRHPHWETLYHGTEPDGPHSATFAGDGALIRLRVSPADDGNKLYLQRITSPGPDAAFDHWSYTGYYGVITAACCASDTEVSIFWIDTSRRLRYMKSQDCGQNWSSAVLLDYTPSVAVAGATASYAPGGKLAVFYAEQNNVYVKKHRNGVWENTVAWDRQTGTLSGIACLYSDDWCLLVTGEDTQGNRCLWAIIHGDGKKAPCDSWSTLQEIVSAPSDSGYDFHSPTLAIPDILRCYYVEHFAGQVEVNRLYGTCPAPGAGFTDNLWQEPAPHNYTGESGMVVTAQGNRTWLISPHTVWRTVEDLPDWDASGDVLRMGMRLAPFHGELDLELDNSRGNYNLFFDKEALCLSPNSRLEISPGYVTREGTEAGEVISFYLKSCQFACSEGSATVRLTGHDGWYALEQWTARHRYRWNYGTPELNVRQIIEFILARAGLRLNVISHSYMMESLYPDFTVQAGERGKDILKDLLDRVPDLLWMEGDNAFLINPTESDPVVYEYGTRHTILRSEITLNNPEFNHVAIEGHEDTSGRPLIGEAFIWNGTADRFIRIEDPDLTTLDEVCLRAEAFLQKMRRNTNTGSITVRVNCGQQMYDVIEITTGAPEPAVIRARVTGIRLDFNPLQGEYVQIISLGEVR